MGCAYRVRGAYGTDYLYLSDSSKDFFAIALDGAANPFNLHSAPTWGWGTSIGGAANDYEVSYIVPGPGLLAVVARRDMSGDDDLGVIALFDVVDDVDDSGDNGADFDNPIFRSNIEEDTRMGRPEFDGDRLIIPADNDHVTHIYDVSDLDSPVLRQSISTPSANPMSVAVADDYYYVAGRWAGILVLGNGDTLSTTAANATPSLAGDPEILDVRIDGDRAYMIDGDGVFHVLDLSPDPASPRVTGSFDLAIPAEQAYYSDTIAIIGSVVSVCSKKGFTLIDVSDPNDPREIGTILESARPAWAIPHGDVCLVLTVLQGALVVDIADPESPEVVSTLPIPGTAEVPAMRDPRRPGVNTPSGRFMSSMYLIPEKSMHIMYP